MKKGTKRSKESCEKHSKSISGINHWSFGIPRSNETKEKLRQANLGKRQSKETIEKRIKSNLGRKRTQETKNKISKSHIGKKKPWAKFSLPHFSGEKHPNWKGGKTPFATLFKGRKDFSIWRLSIFQRDNFTCKKCLQKGGKLHVHHIFPVKKYHELIMEKNNGVTLCVNCHRLFHKLYGIDNANDVLFNKYLGLK